METTGSTATEGVPSVEISIPTEQRSFSYDHYYQTTDYGRNLDLYRPLLEAAMENKWTSVTDLINNHPSSVEVPITICGRTALHIAAGAGHSTFVLKLVELMPAEALELKDKYDGNTALHLAVIAGLDDAVKQMVQKNRNLTRVCNKKGLNPLLNAAIHVTVKHREIISFLSGVMKDEEPSNFRDHLGAYLICSITRAGIYELAYNLIREHPSLATAQEDNGNTMLDVLAEDCNVQRPAFVRQSAMYFQLSRTRQYRFIDKPSTFLEMLFYPGPIYRGFRSEQLRSSIILPELVKIIFEEVSHMSKEDMYPFFFRSNFLKIAAETGSIEILKRCISTYPDQLWFPREGRNIFQLAVENRQDNIFDYLYDHMNADEKILTTRTVDSNGGNILHVAAKIAPPSRLNIYSRPVLQMQREINWYKVENRVPPALRKMRNDQGETPPEVFTREHKDLVKNAEAYMIRTAESCLIVAALVATVAFAAAFTAPGGNFSDSDATNKGKPIFLGKKSFLLFMVLDALALFSSTYSIQVFLSAYGMTHSEARYQSVIPTKLMMGFVCLKISVVSVMIAFSIALSIILGNTYVWAPYVIGGVACFCSSPSLGYLFGLRLNHVAIYYPKNF
ncbi:ankyrin repeat-containing protein NPR4-like isoform X2 [Papaver somniferum]|uniref:ankyrin repeat-containing protein NPR4-like isoform X2 n=1 Tax=Papaver somniferum TaxID=3469 RepID=UPI000E70348E|nr:ankyrin repeat-containing protein NPR4-like isoform X2 [Papaver somniferum]